MKKLFYIMLLVVTSSLAMTACADEDVKPTRRPNTGGGGMLDPL